MNPDFSRIDDAQLSLSLSDQPSRGVTMCFARAFNAMILMGNLTAVNNVIDRNFIDPVICKLLQEQCPAVSLVGCTSSDFKHAVLPEGWKWQTQDTYLQLIDGDGAIQFSWCYGLLKYNS
jgi:hypothetical protein